MTQAEQQDVCEAHERRRQDMRLREMLKDDSITLFTLEGQLKVCGCFLVMLVAIAGILASAWAIIYAILDWRKQELAAYTDLVKDWNLTRRYQFTSISMYLSTEKSHDTDQDSSNTSSQQMQRIGPMEPVKYEL